MIRNGAFCQLPQRRCPGVAVFLWANGERYGGATVRTRGRAGLWYGRISLGHCSGSFLAVSRLFSIKGP